MITLGKIRKEFEYFPETDCDGFYSGILEFERQNKNSELYFTSKNKKVTVKQIENFNYFMSIKNEIRTKAEKFISDDIKRKKYKNYEDFLKGNFEFDIITVHGENSESDIEIICSKNYKKLFWNKRLDYVIFIKDSKVFEVIKFGE